jgi:type IV pilus assembly protein PilQ
MIKRKNLLLSLAFILLSGLITSAFAVSEITNIEVRDVDGSTEISINSTAPLNYTIYKPSDPYLVVVELRDVTLGRFTDKMVIDRAGVREITPSKVEGMEDMVRLEIALSVPADVKPLQKDNALVLTFVNPEEEITAAEAEGATRIEAIDFSRTEDSLLVTIKADGMMSPEVSQPVTNKVVIDIPDVTTSVEAPKVYEPPMGGMRIATYPDKTRIVFDLLEPVEYDVSSGDDQIVVSFRLPSAPVAGGEEVAPGGEMAEEEPSVSSECGRIAASKEYEGEKINIDFQDAELVHIFRLFSDISGCNIVVSPSVLRRAEKFTMRLRDVPWDQALDVILRNYGLSKKVEGNIIRIAPTAEVVKEEEEIARRKEAELQAGDLITKHYPLNFADADEVKGIIEEISKKKGVPTRTTISIDKRTNTLIIRDVEKMHEEYARVIRRLDRPTPQVMIEARVVEVTSDFAKGLGIQWGAETRLSPHMKIGGIEELSGGTGMSGSPFLVNLPAAVGSGTGGSIGFGYIGAGALRSLDLQLSAMETTGEGKIISNPKIITTDNQEATIKQGRKIPYASAAPEGGTQIQFIDASLELTVTPHITPSKMIQMDIKIKKNEQGPETAAGFIIEQKEIETKVLVNNNDTLVIGGIYKTNIQKGDSYVPLLGKIPVLGWLFKKRSIQESKTELLIFITPKVIEQSAQIAGVES